MLASAGGMLASPVLKEVVKKISTVINGRITLQMNLKKHLEEMKMTLESIEALLKDAERRSIKEEGVCLWLKRLTNAMNDISVMMDEFQDDMKPAGRKWPIIPSCCLAIGPKISMAGKMEMMREQLNTVGEQHVNFHLMAGTTSDVPPVRDQRETASTVEEKIIPRPDEENKMMASLDDGMTQNLTILPIYGIGGIGKTTLARKVFHHSQFIDYTKVWVYVSQTFDLKKIANYIISKLSKSVSSYTDIDTIHMSLNEQFTDHKEILIVLDDLWQNDPVDLTDLQTMLKLGEGRKVVVVTTRNEGIARKISTIEPHRVAPLTVDMCWDILKQQSDFASRGGTKEYEDIGKGIAIKCGGVALAAQSLGYMLKDILFDEWSSVRDDDIWNVSTLEDTPFKVLASLTLSYSVMPPSLKLCFAYCAIFPKGHKISKVDIIYQWASLGFIEPPGMLPTWKQSGEECIRQLLGLSFLEHSKSPLTSGEHHADVTLFTMHDLVHDLASSIMEDQILVANKPNNSSESRWRYALLNDCSKSLKASTKFPAKIRALRFMDCEETNLEGAAFSSATSLRVLDLGQCSIHKLSGRIGRLKQLRYLNAPGLQDTLVPNSITGLTKLIYLSLRGSKFLTLPDSIGQLESLLYLDLSECLIIEELPESLGELKKLEYLNLRGLYRIPALPTSIGNITSLLYLDLSGCEHIYQLPASFAKLKNLVHLDLSRCPVCILEALNGFTKLQHLNLSVYRYRKLTRELPKFSGNLINLRYLNLSGCMEVMAQSEEEIDSLFGSISTLTNLEHLDMSYNRNISSLPESIGNLKKLHTLSLLGCFRIQMLPKSMAKMECLKVLNLKEYDSRLEESALLGLNVASLPQFVVSRGEYGSNLILLRPTNPDEMLEISRLENVMSAEEAESIELVEKNTIKKLMFTWSVNTERIVDDKVLLEKLVPPSSLRQWQVDGYMGASIPDWLMDIGHYLPNLSEVHLSDFPKCKNLPPFGQLPNLVMLSLSRMESMEKWNMTSRNGVNELMFPKLEWLAIKDCPKLTIEAIPPRTAPWTISISKSDNVLLASAGYVSQAGASSSSSPLTNLKLEVDDCNLPLGQWRLLHHLPALHSLTINSRVDLAASPEIIQKMSSLESLSIGHASMEHDQAELPAWLFQLTSLQKLDVRCLKLDGLNKEARQLKQLQSLDLYRCGSMASQPQWLGDLTSLRVLRIISCDWIKSLPDSIRQLTKLETLDVQFCDKLTQWCKSEDNMMKLAHIKYIKNYNNLVPRRQ